MKRFILFYILICSIVFATTSCKDDFIADITIGEGNARVSATLDFKPMSSALTRTKAAGNALKDINSLHVLLYDYNTKECIKNWEITVDKYTVSDENRTGSDAENGVSAEAMTKRATFEFPEEIPFGRYYMYAVANIPNLLTNTEYFEAIKTVDGLKSLPLTWNNTDMSKNGQMMGCFTNSSTKSGDESLVLNEKNVKLHAWLRRAASKVTVAYDGSALKEGVFIYLQSVQIKDIPSQCYLGKNNNVGAEDYRLNCPEKGKETELPDGEIIIYHEGDQTDDFEYGEDCAEHRITVGTPRFGSHEETAEALYFYENIQGAGNNMPDKRQDADNNGVLDFPGLPNNPDKYPNYRLKDDVPYGTYIEVKAHYISNNPERLGNGSIIYRFMLGQNVINDYNTKRNCHYKLTLKFKNFANEADWHIEYEEPEPGVMTPEPYYISYLYNHSMMFPFKVNTGGHKIESIKAEIIDNRWAPHNATPEIYYDEMDLSGQNPWNGFLSLHKTTQTILPTPPGTVTVTSNQTYYEKVPKRGVREYRNFEEGEYTTENSESDDKYRVEKHRTETNTYNIYIPMYTRAKQMIVSTGYTGNNPYVAYQRRAEVKITTKLTGVETPFENIVPVYQVRRIVNPKGIYRSATNNKSFHVQLKRLPQENATDFKTFPSEGAWKAYIVKAYNGDNITLSGSGQSELVKNEDPEYGDVVHGKTGSVIDFNVDFTAGIPGVNHYAIIRVEYHNYTCQHLIFVRQGNEPDNLLDDGTLWYAENMRTKTERASTPLDEGSLFKFGNWDDPIDALNNKNPIEPWTRVEPGDFSLYPTDGFTIAGTSKKKTWSQITSKSNTEAFEDPVSGMQVAEDADYRALLDSDDIEQGYGILYGDDASETANHINDAYGYDYAHNNTGRGMRGCFVYNKTTGKSLFFPIGASGYGHRKNSEGGILRYSSGRTSYYPSPGINVRPLFYDLFRRPGAIYWYAQRSNAPLGWDINYFTFDFNNINSVDLGNGADACFVRCVKK